MQTVSTKTRLRKTAEIERTEAAMARCQQGHTADEEGITVSQDEPRRVSLAEARAAQAARTEASAAYEQARLRFELAEAALSRREELGLSQRQVAERAGMTQPGVARFEAGGTTPTLLLLERLATALGLNHLNISPPSARVTQDAPENRR
jgi:HTH-type transcriptional regulator / antitoxin HipB